MNQSLTVTTEISGSDSCILHVSGYLDVKTYSKMDIAFQLVITAGRRNITIDLSGIEYLSSHGFGVFMEAMATVKQEGGTLRFVNLSEKARRIFDLLGVMTEVSGTASKLKCSEVQS